MRLAAFLRPKERTSTADDGSLARRLFDGDPFVREGLLESSWLRNWTPDRRRFGAPGSYRGRITPIGERSGPFRHRSSTWATRAAIGPFAEPLPARILESPEHGALSTGTWARVGQESRRLPVLESRLRPSTCSFTSLRGLDLNQRPLGYEAFLLRLRYIRCSRVL